MEQPLRQRRGQQCTDVAAPRRGPEHENPIGIAAERADVALDPLQHRDLVEAAVIAGDLFRPLGVQRGMSQETERAETQVVERRLLRFSGIDR